jgi:hypothetical protein
MVAWAAACHPADISPAAPARPDLREHISYVSPEAPSAPCAWKPAHSPIAGEPLATLLALDRMEAIEIVGDRVELPTELLLETLAEGHVEPALRPENSNLPVQGPAIPVRLKFAGQAECALVTVWPSMHALDGGGATPFRARLPDVGAVCPAARDLSWATRGMLRVDLEKRVTMDGGLQPRNAERYVLPGCKDARGRVVKVTARFTPADLGKASGPNDRLERVSPPYFELAFN